MHHVFFLNMQLWIKKKVLEHLANSKVWIVMPLKNTIHGHIKFYNAQETRGRPL